MKKSKYKSGERVKSRLPRKVKKEFVKRRGRSEFLYQHNLLNDPETSVFSRVFKQFDLW